MSTHPTNAQLAVWKAYMYDGMTRAEGMRLLGIKHRAGFDWHMLVVTKYVLSKHPRLL